MSKSPRHRTKPRNTAPPAPAQDATPDDLFIRVYPARLRRLIQSHELTRAQLGALLVLALRMDQDNVCYPGRKRTTLDTAYSDERWTATMLGKLEAKGVIQVERQTDQSHTYTLPDAFKFGGKPQQGGVGISHNQSEGNPHPNNIPALTTFSKNEESSTLREMLITAGVKPREAALIADQFSTTLIQQVINEAAARAAQQQISSPGAWIRATLEIRSGKKINYGNGANTHEHTTAGRDSVRPRRPW